MSNVLPFVFAATALLGSPGPGIASLVAVGRSRGLRGGLAFYGMMQVGLALAAAISAAGLFSVLQTLPLAAPALTVVALVYLAWLAWSIAAAPVGQPSEGRAGSLLGGFLVGFANPKAYLVFASLMASFAILERGSPGDSFVKWALCVAVMVVVDLAWLALGVALGGIRMAPRAERLMNLTMAAAIVAAAALTLI